MNAPTNLKYTKSDEWFDPATGAMGLTDYAQDQLSDIVFVEHLVDVGDTVAVGDAIASVESVKASAETLNRSRRLPRHTLLPLARSQKSTKPWLMPPKH